MTRPLTARELTPADITAAALELGCDIHAIRAVDAVESAGSGFDRRGRVKILFEPHLFHANTGGIYSQSHPHLSYPKWKPAAPSYQRDQHQVLAEARALPPRPGQPVLSTDEAAVRATSWGRYQLLGKHFALCGCSSLAEWEARMLMGEAEHLKAFVRFIASQPGLLKALRSLDWPAFARLYNGKKYAEHGYHTRLAAAYLQSVQEHSRGNP
jgi:hypothetical protein